MRRDDQGAEVFAFFGDLGFSLKNVYSSTRNFLVS